MTVFVFASRTRMTAIIPIVEFDFHSIWIHHMVFLEACCWVVVGRKAADMETFSSQIATFDVCRILRL